MGLWGCRPNLKVYRMSSGCCALGLLRLAAEINQTLMPPGCIWKSREPDTALPKRSPQLSPEPQSSLGAPLGWRGALVPSSGVSKKSGLLDAGRAGTEDDFRRAPVLWGPAQAGSWDVQYYPQPYRFPTPNEAQRSSA